MEIYTDEPGTSGQTPATSHASLARTGEPALAGGRATIRTYRHGAGDSHLVTLPGQDGNSYRILIEGVVAPSTTHASPAQDKVIADIVEQSGGHVDLLVATQQTADHFPGYFHSAEALAKLDVGEVWLAWTEDPADPEAGALHGERERALDKVRLAAAEVQLRGSEAESHAISSLLAFYGVAGRASTGDPLAALRAKTTAPRYCRPGDARELPGFGARIYLFGPPSGEAGIPAWRDASGANLALYEFVHNVVPNLEGNAVDNPFSTLYSIPEPVARSMPFFQKHYWEDAPWRRIDAAWIADATQYALVLDSLTNGTNLGLAVELDGGDVLLFAPDGQPGTGLLSGQQAWSAGEREVDGRDLLTRTVFYKVGHHGGLNATAGQDELGLMPKLRVAVIPVDQAAALPAGGDDVLRIDALQRALADAIRDRGYVLRTDKEPPAVALTRGVTATAEYFDLQL